MDNARFAAWCDTAVALMKYSPDKAGVRAELLAHMEDRFEALSAAGLSLRDAEAETVRAMGSAADLAPALARIHKPFFGYVLRVTNWVLAISVIAMLLSLFGSSERLQLPSAPEDFYGAVWYGDEDVLDHGRRTKNLYPNVTAYSDGYAFTVTRAVEWQYEYTAEDGSELRSDSFDFLVTVFNPRPWAEHTDILREFHAVDSLGNYYAPSWESGYTSDLTVSGNPYRSGYLTTSHYMWLSNYVAQGAEWIDLCYDRAGRDIVLRIDLTGGAPA